MLCKRLVTLLTLNEGVLYRTKEFFPDYRYTLNFVDSWLVDEIIILNISNGSSRFPQFLEVAGSIADGLLSHLLVVDLELLKILRLPNFWG